METGCSSLHYIIGCFIIQCYPFPLPPPPTAPHRNEYPQTRAQPNTRSAEHALVGWHYLSNATCRIRCHLSYACCRVKDHHNLQDLLSPLKRTCVRRVVLCMYAYIHIYTHIHVYACMYTYIHIYIYIYVRQVAPPEFSRTRVQPPLGGRRSRGRNWRRQKGDPKRGIRKNITFKLV